MEASLPPAPPPEPPDVPFVSSIPPLPPPVDVTVNSPAPEITEFEPLAFCAPPAPTVTMYVPFV